MPSLQNTVSLLDRESATGAGPPVGDTRKEDTLFAPHSQICRVQREALVLLAGGRAILMQLAHPLVAAGVADYSNFQSDPLQRLFRTLFFMHTVVFDERGRPRILDHFHRLHARIRGRLTERIGPYPEGTPYAGDDPALKLWVHATFIDSSLEIYERFVTPLSPDERMQYYADTLQLGKLMEIPGTILPPTLQDFRSYMEGMIDGDDLVVSTLARRLAAGVLYPEVGFVPRMSARLLRLVTAGTLPEQLREAFQLPWSRRHEMLLDVLSRMTRRLRPHVGPWIWKTPLLGGGLARLLLWGTSSSPSGTERPDNTCPYSDHE